MECCRPVVNACPPSTSAQNTWNSWDQDPQNAYNNAYYHYQAYVYYWNLYNSHFSQGRYNNSYCECYDFTGQGTDSTGYPMELIGSRCVHCPEEGLICHDETYGMDIEQQTYDDGAGAGIHEDDDNDNDDDEHNFELDEKFCQFLRQSEKHRKEREKERKANAKLDEYVEAGKLYLKPSTMAPQEQQGVKRRKEMKSLYGDKAQYIMSLEASLQLHYDRNYDTRQPNFWPHIPLKF